MAYLEFVPTGRADDLMAILVKAEGYRYARTGVRVPEKPGSRRAWVEPLGNALGRGLSGALRLAPGLLARLQDAVWKKMASPNLFAFEPGNPRLQEARRLIAELGGKPALVCLFTHPPVTGEWLHLNVELTRHALWALRRLRPGSRPRLIVAVDPFALDGFGLLEEGVYAGFMGTVHLGFDRLASHRGAASRAMLGFASWERMGWRLARWLGGGGEAGIPLGGGVATTSRPLYSAKEFVWSLRRARTGRAPAEAAAALAEDSGFRAFAEAGLAGPALRKSAWRMMEAWLAALVSGAWGRERGAEASADLGRLTPAAREAAEACGRALGFSAAEAAARAQALDRELARETPYRARLFRILAKRLAARGRPVVLLPLSHGTPPEARMSWGEPAALVAAKGEEATVMKAGGERRTLPIDSFARAFVDRNLP